jgi:hypothetical protein
MGKLPVEEQGNLNDGTIADLYHLQGTFEWQKI